MATYSFVDEFKALADENRVAILKIMQQYERKNKLKKASDREGISISAIADKLDITLPTVSHHMKELARADLITIEKVGRNSYCELNKETLLSLKEFFQDLVSPKKKK